MTGRTLLVASPGGHLAELVDLARAAGQDDTVWLTPETPQSRDLLAGQHRIDIVDVRSRDVRGLARAAVQVRRVLDGGEFDTVVSTGAAVALAVLPQAAARGMAAHYVESSARVKGPSLSGRLLRMVPGVRMWTQYPRNAAGRWSYVGSVFESFDVCPAPARQGPLNVVVTLGTRHEFGFGRLVSRLQQVLPDDAHVTWQASPNDLQEFGLNGAAWMDPRELSTLMSQADVVIAHAGVGSALAAMNAGAFPVLVPRRARHHEHVDDHQTQIGTHLENLGVAFSPEVGSLTASLIEVASRLRLKARAASNSSVLQRLGAVQ